MLNQMQKPKFYYIFIEKNKEAKLVMWFVNNKKGTNNDVKGCCVFIFFLFC